MCIFMCIFVKQIENHGVLTVSAWWFQVEDSTWLCQPQGTVDFLVVSTWLPAQTYSLSWCGKFTSDSMR